MSLRSVAYTHLDVYKRQQYLCVTDSTDLSDDALWNGQKYNIERLADKLCSKERAGYICLLYTSFSTVRNSLFCSLKLKFPMLETIVPKA